MKKIHTIAKKIPLLLLVMSLSHALISQTFVHPGIPLSSSDLATVKAHITAGDQPWKGGYDGLAADSKSSLYYTMQGPFASVSRNPHINRNQWMNDMTAAWNLSLMWYFTGNEQYATKSRDILLAWANTQTEFVGMEANLDLGDFAYAYGGAASILRGTWSGWTSDNTTTIKTYFNNVFWPSIGCGGYALGPANKGALSLASGAAIAAFSDDADKVNKILYLIRTSGSCGFQNTLPTGEIGESARDQGHAYGQWLSLVFVAEVMWKQGIDIYSYLDNRFAAIGEFYARKNLGLGVPYIPYGTTDYLYNTDGTAVWGGADRGFQILHGAYVIRKGIQIPFSEKFRNTVVGNQNFMFYKTSDNSTATAPASISFPSANLTGTGLTNTDIGGAYPAGSCSFSNGRWTVSGAGTEIWTHSTESFNFTYKQVTGDCSIIAKTESVIGGNSSSAKGGVMIASDLTSNPSKRAWIAITPNKTAEAYMHGYTEVRGGSNWEKWSRPITQSSYWVKIERIGDVINLYYSPDGTSWAVEAEGRFLGFSGAAYIGLAVCSVQTGTLSTATFSGVSTTDGTGGVEFVPDSPLALMVSGGNSQSTLRWTPSFGASSYAVKRAIYTNGVLGSYADVASGIIGSVYTNTGLSNNQLYSYKVRALNSVGTSPDSPADTVRPMSQAVITTIPSGMAFDELNTTGSFTVIGSDIDDNIVITAPVGITVSPTTISAGIQPNITVSVTYNGTTTPVNGNIVLTCGTTVKNVAVTAVTNASCFEPLYPAGNLIVDPTCNSYVADGWGNKSINTDPAFVYCGSRSGKISSSGSFDRLLTGVMKPNTFYRVKAKVWKVSGTVGIGVYGWNGNAADFYHEVSTAGSWQDVDFTFTTGSTLKSTGQGIFFNNGNGYIDNWEMYELPPPTLVTSLTSLLLDDMHTTGSITVTGANLIYDITLSAPTGILVNPTSIAAGSASNTPISVTYDGTTTVHGNITFTSGSTITNVAITGTPSCYTPLYSSGNLVTNPTCTNILTYKNWGNGAVVSDANAYCGSSIRVTGDCGGSIDYSLTGKMASNTAYRLKAMMYTNGNGADITLNGCGINGTTADYIYDVNTGGTWQVVDFTFTTGTLGVSQNFWFNSCGGVKNSTDTRIDNFEIYAMPTWNGTGTWSTAANWGGTVPATGSDIYVRTGSLTIDQNSSVANVTVCPEAKLILNSGNSLTVTGNLTINSDASGTGTFVDANAVGGLTVSGAATVQQYLTGANTASAPNGRFWYMSSPVADATSGVFDAAGANKVWKYTESAHAYTEITDNVTPLAIGKGYAVRLGANSTIAFSGSGLNTNDKTITLTRNDGNEKSGYNLIGNPYPSFLDFHAVTLPANVMPTIWIRSCTIGGTMAFDTYNLLMNTGVSGSGKTVSRYIAPMQAFWVKLASGNTNDSITLTNSMRYSTDQTVGTNGLRAISYTNISQQLLRLQVSNGTNSDETVIAFNSNALDEFDKFDSPKMSNENVAIPEIYTFAGREKVAINGLNSLVFNPILPLGFTTRERRTYTIKATDIQNFLPDTKIVLKDNLLGAELDISDGAAYSFTSDSTTTASRFSVVFESASWSTGLGKGKTNSSITIFKNEQDLITINCNAAIGQEGIVTICNTVGQVIVKTPTTGSSTIINKTLSSGVYYVLVNVSGDKTTKKIIL